MTDKQPNIQWLRDENERLQEQVLALQHIADRDEAEIERLRKVLERITHAPYGRTYCADGHEEAVLIARAALEGK